MHAIATVVHNRDDFILDCGRKARDQEYARQLGYLCLSLRPRTFLVWHHHGRPIAKDWFTQSKGQSECTTNEIGDSSTLHCQSSSLHPDPLVQTAACVQLLQSTINDSGSATLSADLASFLDYVLAPDFPQMVARPTVTEYVANLPRITDREQRKSIMAMSLDKMQPRLTTFEEQVGENGKRVE